MNLSTKTNASARGGHRATLSPINFSVPRFDPKVLVWISNAQRLMRETGCTAEQVIAAGRSNGSIQCSDGDVPSIVTTLNEDPFKAARK